MVKCIPKNFNVLLSCGLDTINDSFTNSCYSVDSCPGSWSPASSVLSAHRRGIPLPRSCSGIFTQSLSIVPSALVKPRRLPGNKSWCGDRSMGTGHSGEPCQPFPPPSLT